MTEIKLSIQPMERSGNSVSPMGPAAECCSVLLQQNALGQRSARSLFTSTLLYSFLCSQASKTDAYPTSLVMCVISVD